MSVLEIPCTRLTKKIITQEYGADPVPLSRSHPLWVFIRPHAPGDRIGKSHIIKDREASFLVSCRGSAEKLLRENLNDAGAGLHRHHVEMMNRFVWGRYIDHLPAKQSLRIFYELYGLTDVDYDFDSAYRSWQRFRTDMEEKIYRKHCQKRAPGVLISGKPGDQVQPAEDDVDGLSKFITGRLKTRRPYLPCYVLRQVAIWLHVEYGRFSKSYVADKYGISERTVRHSLQKINGYIEVDAEFEKLVQPKKMFQNACVYAE